MPTPRREAALAALTAALDANLAAAYTVARNRTASILDDYAVTVIEGEGRVAERIAADDTALRVTVTAARVGIAQDQIGSAASALHADLVAAALADPTLGGTCDWLRQARMQDPDIGQVKGRRADVLVAVEFEITFQTPAGSPAG